MIWTALIPLCAMLPLADETPPPAPNQCYGDVNHDGEIDIFDIFYVMSYLSCEMVEQEDQKEPLTEQEENCCDADANEDEMVDVMDLGSVWSRLGASCEDDEPTTGDADVPDEQEPQQKEKRDEPNGERHFDRAGSQRSLA